MGLDLRLLPLDSFNGRSGFSHTVLNVHRHPELYDDLSAAATCIPEGLRLSAYVGSRVPDGHAAGELMYGNLRPTDAYGDRYTWVAASMLAAILAKWAPDAPTTAYVKALPSATSDPYVVLDWH